MVGGTVVVVGGTVVVVAGGLVVVGWAVVTVVEVATTVAVASEFFLELLVVAPMMISTTTTPATTQNHGFLYSGAAGLTLGSGPDPLLRGLRTPPWAHRRLRAELLVSLLSGLDPPTALPASGQWPRRVEASQDEELVVLVVGARSSGASRAVPSPVRRNPPAWTLRGVAHPAS